MKYTLSVLLFCFFIFSCKKEYDTQNQQKTFKIGIITDCQFCDCDTKNVSGADRYYRKAPERLRNAVAKLNTQNLEFTIHLGDFIDQDFKSFETVVPIWEQLNSKSYHVLGNHDFSVADSLKSLVPAKMGLTDRYYSFEKYNWKFIVLDGNDTSLHGSLDSLKLNNAKNLLAKVQKDSLIYAKFYNGGLGSEQLNWVKSELDDAKKRNQNVCFFNHFPASPITKLNFWDRDAFLSLVKDYPNVKLYLNGHDHAGSYDQVNDVHYITFKGMVDTEDTNTFAYAEFSKDSVYIHGYGREESRKLKLK